MRQVRSYIANLGSDRRERLAKIIQYAEAFRKAGKISAKSWKRDLCEAISKELLGADNTTFNYLYVFLINCNSQEVMKVRIASIGQTFGPRYISKKKTHVSDGHVALAVAKARSKYQAAITALPEQERTVLGVARSMNYPPFVVKSFLLQNPELAKAVRDDA